MRVPYSVSCMIVLLACITEHIAAIFFAQNGIHRNTKMMLMCFVYEQTRLNCQHSDEFFFLYDNTKNKSHKYIALEDEDVSNSSAQARGSEETATPSDMAENVTSGEMEVLYKGNSFFMMPMYLSKFNRKMVP